MFIIPKIALTLFAVLPQSPQNPQQDIHSNFSDQTKQYSVLERIEPSTSKPQPVARVAQLPQEAGLKSSRRKLDRLPKEQESARPEFDEQPRFQLRFAPITFQ